MVDLVMAALMRCLRANQQHWEQVTPHLAILSLILVPLLWSDSRQTIMSAVTMSMYNM